MKTVQVLPAKTLATELFDVLKEKALIEKREEELRGALLESLVKQGVKYVRLDSGTSFTRSHRESLKVVDEEKARAWAEEHYCLKVDTNKAMKILRREFKMPKFFKRFTGSEYLTIKSKGQEE